MRKDLIAIYEIGKVKNLVPGQSFLHRDAMCFALNRTDRGYLVRKINNSEGFELEKEEDIEIIKSLKIGDTL